MTGFGVGEAPTPAGRLAVEIRAVNHRFLDVRVRAPRDLVELVPFAEQLAREKLVRGRVEIGIRLDGGTGVAVTLDEGRARAAYRALCELRDELAPGSDVPLSLLSLVPDLFVSSSEQQRDAMRAGLRACFDLALAALDVMRREEGRALAEDLRTRLGAVRRGADAIAARVPAIVEGYQKRLKARVARLLGEGAQLDPGRLEQETALLADRADVAEELTRLSSHCTQYESLLDGGDAVGRRLDFLLQEMVREVNTIGSKAQDAEVAHLVVDVKSELERMREQVQNVE